MILDERGKEATTHTFASILAQVRLERWGDLVVISFIIPAA